MQRRRELLQSITQQVANHAWQLCAESTFRVLYGLPATLQIQLAVSMMRRYLFIFESKNTTIAWTRQLLNAPDEWVKKFRRQVPEEPEMLDPADSAFWYCFDALLLAHYYQTNQTTLTSSCTCAIYSAISARQTNVWIADDPEAVEMWKEQGYFPGRSVVENVASIAVAEREWCEVVRWLQQEEVETYVDEVNISELKQALAEWKEHDMLLIKPKDPDLDN